MPGLMIWDVSVQQDFLPPKGKLPVPGADETLPRIAALLEAARARGTARLSVVIEHRLEDPLIALRGADLTATFPPHCLRGTPGVEQAASVRQVLEEIAIPSRTRGPVLSRTGVEGGAQLLVRGFDPFSSPEAERLLASADPAAVVVCGFPLELSVRAAVEGLRARGRTVRLVRDCVVALRAEAGEALLDAWRTDEGIELHERAGDPLWRQ